MIKNIADARTITHDHRGLRSGALSCNDNTNSYGLAQLFGLPFLFLAAGLLPTLGAGIALLLTDLKKMNGDLSALEVKTRSNLSFPTQTGDIPF